MTPEGFLRRVRLDADAGTGHYPFTVPVVAWLARSGGLDLALAGQVRGW